MNKISLGVLFSIPKTIWFNFRYLPLFQAIKLPIWVALNVRIKSMYRSGIILSKDAARFNSVHIGYHKADAVDTYAAHTVLCIEKGDAGGGGKLIITDDAHIGHGAIIHVKKEGILQLGKNFAISGTTSIVCSKRIKIGDDVQFSWNSLVMDSDAHKIFDETGREVNMPSPIVIGNKVWIAANCTILKGTKISDHTVVGCNSLLNKEFPSSHVLIVGMPGKIVKKLGDWEL